MMHKRKVVGYFRNLLSGILALSMITGSAGTGVSTVFASETVEEKQVVEKTVNETEEVTETPGITTEPDVTVEPTPMISLPPIPTGPYFGVLCPQEETKIEEDTLGACFYVLDFTNCGGGMNSDDVKDITCTYSIDGGSVRPLKLNQRNSSYSHKVSDFIDIGEGKIGNSEVTVEIVSKLIYESGDISTYEKTFKFEKTYNEATDSHYNRVSDVVGQGEDAASEEGVKVNFGAEVAAPQYTTTDVVLRADATGGYGDVKEYIFYIDEKEVQRGKESTYLWKEKTAGTHKLKVEVWDEEGYATSERTFTILEEEALEVPTPQITEPVAWELDFQDYSARTATELVRVLPNSTEQKVLSVKVGEEITLNCSVKETNHREQVMYTYLDQEQREVILRNYGEEKQAKVTFSEAGDYPLYAYAIDENGEQVKKIGGIVIQVEDTQPSVTVSPTITTEPTITVAPSVTKEPTITVAPSITQEPIITTQPTITIAPSVTKEPTVTADPTVTVAPSVTPEPTITAEPTRPGDVIVPSRKPTVTATVTPRPGGKWDIICDQNNEEFSTDTLQVQFELSIPTVSNEYTKLVSCTYRIDDGLVRECTWNVDSYGHAIIDPIEVGEGKIGNSEIKVNVTAKWSGKTTLEKTFTFKKIYQPMEEGLKVNFGAEVSAPQYTTTDVVLRADATGGYGDIKEYIFYIDEKEVQRGKESTYLWRKKTAGTHKLKVEVWDEEGYATSERTFTVLEESLVTPTKKSTITPTTKITIKTFTVSVASGKAQAGDKIALQATAQGAQDTLKYQFSYSYNGKTKIIKNFSNTNKAVFTPKKAGKYLLTVKVKDSKGNVAEKIIKNYQVREKFAIKGVNVSCKEKKATIKVSVQGTQGSVKYKYVLKRGSKTVKSTSYRKNSTYTVKNLKKGKYKLTVYVKNNNKTIKKTKTFRVK